MWSCLTVWSFNSSLAKFQLNQRNIDRSLLWFINWTKCHATVDFVGTYQGFCWTWPDVWQIFQSINVDFFISTNIASDLLTLCNNLSFTNTVELYLNDKCILRVFTFHILHCLKFCMCFVSLSCHWTCEIIKRKPYCCKVLNEQVTLKKGYTNIIWKEIDSTAVSCSLEIPECSSANWWVFWLPGDCMKLTVLSQAIWMKTWELVGILDFREYISAK